jgi:hypothetical protein
MEGALLRVLISPRSINKHDRHRQFLFLIGRFLKIFSSETAWPNEPELGYREPSIDASYQVSDHLAKQFQRRRFLEINHQKHELPVVAML